MMDTPDIEVPDTIPDHITRRHQRGARKTVTRAGQPTFGLSSRALQLMLWATASIALVGLTTGVVMLWMTYPSPTTFVGIPAVLVLLVYAVGVVAYRNRGSLR
jgi:cytochrome b subunit of formate dehydrogenase